MNGNGLIALALGILVGLVSLVGCDVFVPEKGGWQQPCLGDAADGWVCKDGLDCDENQDPPICVPAGKVCLPNEQLDEGEDCDPISGEIAGDVNCAHFSDFVGGSLACTPECEIDTSGCNYCGNARIDGDEQCDIIAFRDGVDACADLPDANYLSGQILCDDQCRYDLSGCQGCGNGEIDEALGEECDTAGPVFLPDSGTCEDAGFVGGDLICGEDCRLDLSACHNCGNSVRDEGEECEGGDIPYADCQDYNPVAFGSGSLGCNTDCTLDFSQCEGCGNGRIDAGSEEQCDPGGPVFAGGLTACSDWGFFGGELACNGDCIVNTEGCNFCGDGDIQEDEACDPNAVPSVPVDHTCDYEGFWGGELSCNEDCSINTDNCNNCGNGVQNGGEICDNEDFGSMGDQCANVPGENYLSGTLGCNGDCTLDLSQCLACGNENIEFELGEVCDDALLNEASCETEGFDEGQLLCAPDCKSYDTSGCIGCGDGEVLGDEECDPAASVTSIDCADLEFLGDPGNMVTCNDECRWNRQDCHPIFRAIRLSSECTGIIDLSWAPTQAGQDHLMVACGSTRFEVWAMAESDQFAPLTLVREVAELEANATLKGACLLGDLDTMAALFEEGASHYLSEWTWDGGAGTWIGGTAIENYSGHAPDRMRCAVLNGHPLVAVIETGALYGKIYDRSNGAYKLVSTHTNTVDLSLSHSQDSSNLGHLAIATDGTGGNAGLEMYNLQDSIGSTAAAQDYFSEMSVYATALCPDGLYWASEHEEDPYAYNTFTVYPWESEGYYTWYDPIYAQSDGPYGALACRPQMGHDFFAIKPSNGGRSIITLHSEWSYEYNGARDCGPAASQVRMEFSPDGQWLATWVEGDNHSGGGPVVRVWHVDTLRSLLAN